MLVINRQGTAEILKRYREKNGLTYTDVAYFIDTAPNTVKHWETEYRIPSTQLLLRVADMYGVSIYELLDVTDAQ